MDKSDQKPVLLYDGDCGFCKRWIKKWNRMTGDAVLYVPYQGHCESYGVPESDCRKSVQFVDGKTRASGAEAVFRTLALTPKGTWLWRLYRRMPGFAAVSEFLYRIVAANRPFFSRLTPGDSPKPEASYSIGSWMYLRGLGAVFFLAFASLGTQLGGLIGSGGILPAGELLEALSLRFGPERFYLLPTFAWLNSSDAFLGFLCSLGAAAAALVFLNILTVPSLVCAWAAYLSFLSISRDFLGFQWDILLLEAGFLGIFLSPFQVLPSPMSTQPPGPPGPMIFAARWLLFRLMLSSGIVKLASGDSAWKDLSALAYHFETQPLPNAFSWYVHQLPETFHKACAGLVFFIELFVPFLLFGPRPARLFAARVFLVFQVLIFLTGNYGFFNLLTILLCLPVIDDAAWPAGLRGGKDAGAGKQQVLPRRWPGVITLPLALYLLIISLVPFAGSLRQPLALPQALTRAYAAAAPFHVVNGYGLFAVMTTVREEIILQGSRDGVNWETYDFHYKPGSLEGRPRFAAPHQPRLDWQMWFQALQPFDPRSWFAGFCYRLLLGSDSVERLLAGNPFRGKPPKFIRALIYRYRFTTPEERAATGRYWERSGERLYLAPVSLPESAVG